MSRIFTISGNFTQHGKWANPDPSFSGKIVVDDNDEFYGFCDELYDSNMSQTNRTRYIAGAFAGNGRNGNRGIAFYKLSNDEEQAPLMYVVPDLTDDRSGTWAAMTFFGFCAQGKARIAIEEEPFSAGEKDRIMAKYQELNKGINGNGELIAQVYCCVNILTHAV